MAQGSDKPQVKTGDQRVAQVYAESFLHAADQAGEAEAATADYFAFVDELLPNFPNAETYFASAVVPVGERALNLDKALEGRCANTFLNFLQVLNRHGRLNLLRAIRTELRDLLDERARRRRVYVNSAVPLSDAMRESLRETLKRRMQFEPTLVESVDPDLLGGFVVRVLDFRFDGSVRTYLETLKKQLIERSSHAIQSGRDRFSSAG